ncbi:MAG TPA: hypothetical protein VL593_18335 [Ramlibacter sp.]|nr:hypothetical protein [Ramlibacter sp.]
MNAERPTINVIEKNPYLPQPFVLTEVAICLRDAIRAAGYASEHLVNHIDPAAYSIVLGGSPALEKELPHLDRERCAIFNFEQLGSTSNLAGPQYRAWLAHWLVLDYHASNVELLKRENGPAQRAFELPLVPSANLVTTGDEPKSVDVLFYGTMSDRRSRVIAQLESMGLKVEVVAGAYGHELAPAVRRAKLVLHVHFYEQALFPVARVLQPVMMGVPVVCETSVFSELNDWSHSGVVFAHYAHLAETCRDLLDAPERMVQRARLSRDFVQHIDFAKPFERVVRAFETQATKREDGALTDAEIEAILAAEGASPPEADQPAPQLQVIRREPGQGRFGAWLAWLLVLFMIAGAIKAYF